jgi:hypothetical protein
MPGRMISWKSLKILSIGSPAEPGLDFSRLDGGVDRIFFDGFHVFRQPIHEFVAEFSENVLFHAPLSG